MKICMTLSCTFPGETGTPLHAMGVVRQLKKAGIDIFVVQFNGGVVFTQSRTRLREYRYIASHFLCGRCI